jgi:hypothetical protein
MQDTLTKPRPPMRLPVHSPVTALHVRADNDVNGNPRRCFVVSTLDGLHVETLDEGYSGEAALFGRYPWFHSAPAGRLGLKRANGPQRIDVQVSEYRRMMRREGHEGTEAIRARANRYARRFDPFGHRREG